MKAERVAEILSTTGLKAGDILVSRLLRTILLSKEDLLGWVPKRDYIYAVRMTSEGPVKIELKD